MALCAGSSAQASLAQTSGDFFVLTHDEGEGYCTDQTNQYVMFRTHLLKIAGGPDFATGAIPLLASNMNTVAFLPGVNHCGGMKYYNGLIYCAAENWQSIGHYSSQTLALYRADNCQFVSSHSLTESGREASGLAIIPNAGKHGLIAVSSYDTAAAPEARELSLFDLQTYRFEGYLVLNKAVSYAQDAAFNPRDQRLYILGDGPGLVPVNLDGVVGDSLYNAGGGCTLEGFDFWHATSCVIEVNNPGGAPASEVLFTLSLSYQGPLPRAHAKVSLKITPPG